VLKDGLWFLNCIVLFDDIFVVVGYCKKRLSCERLAGNTTRETGWFALAVLPAVFDRSITAELCDGCG
jgi:hypothetical protein